MKFSNAMLKGFAEVNGKQCKGSYSRGPFGNRTAYCAMGAAYAGSGGKTPFPESSLAKFFEQWGTTPISLNDDGMPWEHIYGMAVAAGL